MARQKNEVAAPSQIGRRPWMNRRGFFNAALAATATAVTARQLAADERPQRAAIGTSSSRSKNEFKPGDRVPVSAVYDVTHDKVDGGDHALPHQVSAIAGTKFPSCRVCGAGVKFRLRPAAERVESNGHFKL
jgi:hypothetical protein